MARHPAADKTLAAFATALLVSMTNAESRGWAAPSAGAIQVAKADASQPSERQESTAEAARRYPYDPVCPWGRLGDGHGMLVRCLSHAEASGLLEMPGNTPTEAPGPQAPPPSAKAPAPSADSPPKVEDAKPGLAQISVSQVGPLHVETGSLPEALRQLSKPKSRYVECVQTNGGASKRRLTVTVKFLVRETGRAEGVSVESHDGMTLEAAKCIASVIDRRGVGYPEAPIVGAELTISLAARE